MIGVDTVSIARIAKATGSKAFLERVFTADERAYCEGRRSPHESYAGLFCAKEAAVKALKCGFGKGIMPTDVEITHDANGAPVLSAHGNAAKLFSGYYADVSISHDGDNAVAVVELTKK